VLVVSPHELPEYARFVARYAALAHARLYSETGDFDAARSLAERLFVEGFPVWCRRRRWGHEWADAFEFMYEFVRPHASPPPDDAAHSFRGAKKLRNVEASIAVLRSFPRDAQIALFLEHVAEVPRSQIRLFDLVGETVKIEAEGDEIAILDGPDWTAQLDARLAKKLAAAGIDDPDPAGFFARTMRQHRLPPTFEAGVMNRVAAATQGRRGMPAIVGSIARAALTSAVTAVAYGLILSEMRRTGNLQQANAVSPLALVALADVLVLAASWTLRRQVWFPDRRLPLMRVLDYVGVVAATTAPFFLFESAVFAGAPVFLGAVLVVRLAWWFASVACVVGVGMKMVRASARRAA